MLGFMWISPPSKRINQKYCLSREDVKRYTSPTEIYVFIIKNICGFNEYIFKTLHIIIKMKLIEKNGMISAITINSVNIFTHLPNIIHQIKYNVIKPLMVMVVWKVWLILSV